MPSRFTSLYEKLELWLLKGGFWVHGLVFLALCTFAMSVQSIASFQSAEWRLYDAGVRTLRRMSTPPLANEVVVIGIDEPTFRQFPEPFALWHPHLGRLLQALLQAQPSVVGVDVVLPAKSYETVVPGIDRTLMLPILEARDRMPLVFAQTLDEQLRPRPIFAGYTALMEPWQLASALLCWDEDGVVRRQQSSLCSAQGSNQGLAARMAQRLQVPERGHGLIDFRRGAAMHYIPMHEVLARFEHGDVDGLRDWFQGKPVLVGLVLPLEDRLKVPAPLFAQEPDNSRIPGVMVHAQLLRTLLNQGLLKQVPQPLEWLLIVACCLCWFGYGLKKNIVYWSLFLLIPIACLYVLWLGHVLMPGGMILAAKTAYVSRQALESRRLSHHRKRLTQAFAGHVSPAMLNNILHSRSSAPSAELVPRQTAGAVLVIRLHLEDAGTLSGQAHRLDALAVFYDAVKDTVEHAGGMLDRLHGQEVSAWFGIPVPLPAPEQAALEAALQLQRSFAVWSRPITAAGLNIKVSMGLAAGPLLSGQVSIRGAYPFVVMGQAIELAEQLAAAPPEGRDMTVRVSRVIGEAVAFKGIRQTGTAASYDELVWE